MGYVPIAKSLCQRRNKRTDTKEIHDLQRILTNLEERQFSDQNLLMRKLRSDQRGKYYCLFCLLSFDSPCSLTRHNQEHFEKRNYKTKFLTPQIICILCKKKFFKKSSFINHLMDKLHVN